MALCSGSIRLPVTIPKPACRVHRTHFFPRCYAASSSKRYNGFSDMVDRFLVLFLMQQDLGVQLQRAMNYEQYNIVKQVQHRKAEIEKALDRYMKIRDKPETSMSKDSIDALSQAVALKAQLADAVEKQDYALAATLRDKLQDAQAESEASLLKSNQKKPQCRLGQIVLVNDNALKNPLSGVVVGWDIGCSESVDWKQKNNCESLKEGIDQPFYHVLVDVHEWASEEWDTVMVPSAYVPQERLCFPLDPDSLEYNTADEEKNFSHPFEYLLFLGKDNAGHYVPTAELRNVYGEQRRDVYPPGQEGSDSEEADP